LKIIEGLHSCLSKPMGFLYTIWRSNKHSSNCGSLEYGFRCWCL